VRVASERAVLEVVWSLEGAMRQEGSFETRVTSAGAVRQAAK
jgi:stage V sporulation protein SpoVS